MATARGHERGQNRPGDSGRTAATALHPFLVTPAPAFGIPVSRLGLASYGDTAITPDDVLHAVGRGVNFLKFLLSREEDVAAFCVRRRARNEPPTLEVYPDGFSRTHRK